MAADDLMTLAVSEIFGPTVQGEGPSAGRRCAFVRLGRCNLTCTWCDTPYTWDWDRYDRRAELTNMDVESIADRIDEMGVGAVVLTGGEPLLQQRRLEPLLRRFAGDGIRIEVETNGTIVPSDAVVGLVDAFNVSPKLLSSGQTADKAIVPVALRALRASGKACFKFVASNPIDLFEVDQIVDAVPLSSSSVWIMPEGVHATDVLANQLHLVDAVVERGWNLTTRLHVLLWGDERAR